MAAKSDFTADEWGKLLSSPMMAGMAITAADPSGVWGLIKEGMAGGWALVDARQNAHANVLVKAVAEDFATGDGRAAARQALQARFAGADIHLLKSAALSELATVSEILGKKLRKTLLRLELGFRVSLKKPQRPGQKADSWDLEGSP